MSKALSDIGELPQVVDPERRERGRSSLRAFFDAYLAEHYFYRPYTETLEQIIATAQRVSFDGGKFALSAKRRGSKTTILQCAQLHALLYGIHPYQFFLAATEKKAAEAQEFFMNELENNELIRADFPEICYPIEKREGKQQRSLEYHGRPLKIKIGSEMIRLGLIEREEIVDGERRLVPYPSSGCQIVFKSAGSGDIRGSRYVIRNRGVVRPSLVVADDIQNDGSAKSKVQIEGFEALFYQTLSQIGGYDRETGRIQKPSIFVVGTCIYPNDFQCRMVDREKNPSYQGMVFKRMVSMPENMDMWRKYRDIRAESLRIHGDNRDGTAFYVEHRTEMDVGVQPDDENDYEKDQISATQYAMDQWCENEPGFWCEHQNQPDLAMAVQNDLITPADVVEKSDTKMEQFTLPSESVVLTAHIDVGLNVLWWTVMAWGLKASFGHVVAFGAWPHQPKSRCRKNEISKGEHSIQNRYENLFAEEDDTNRSQHEYSRNQKDKVCRAVADCIDYIFTHDYYVFDPEGNKRAIDIHAESSFDLDNKNGRYVGSGKVLGKHPFLAKCSVDCADGMMEDTVWNAMLDSKWQSRLVASYGGHSKSKLIGDDISDRKMGERFGYHLIEGPEGKREKRRLSKFLTIIRYDVHVFKQETFDAWATPEGMHGCYGISSGGLTKERLQLFAEHQASSQTPEQKIVGSTRYNVFEETGIADDDWFDCVAACRMLNAYLWNVPDATVIQTPRVAKERVTDAREIQNSNDVEPIIIVTETSRELPQEIKTETQSQILVDKPSRKDPWADMYAD